MVRAKGRPRIRTGFGRLPASSPARYKRFAFA